MRLRFHLAAACLLSALALAAYHAAFFEDFQSSDGANYATVARNHMEGRGLKSSVIQPGLMTVVPTDRTGQAYVTQMPLWPLALSYWFRAFGPTPLAAAALAYTFCLVAAVTCWWIGYRLSGIAGGGYLALVLLLSNPHYVSNVVAVYNVAMHSALIGVLFILLWLRPRPTTVLAAGALLGLAVLTREPSVSMLVAFAYCWVLGAREESGARGPLGLGSGKRLLWLSTSLVLVVLMAYSAFALEKWRKLHAYGLQAGPTLRATFLYFTPVLDANWYFIYDFEGLKVDPFRYFLEHPGVLVKKIFYQLFVSLGRQTLPAMQSTIPFFVPVAAPCLVADRAGRRVAWALLFTLVALVGLGTLTTLHLQYFLAYFPAVNALVAATVIALIRRLRDHRLQSSPRRRFLGVALVIYALLPIVLNVGPFLLGRRMPTGEYGMSRERIREFTDFVSMNTERGAVVVSSHSPLMAWHTGRTIIQYSGAPQYRISDSAMWQRIDAAVPIDYILLNSLAGEDPSLPLLDGFALSRQLDRPGLKAWLFKRTSRPLK